MKLFFQEIDKIRSFIIRRFGIKELPVGLQTISLSYFFLNSFTLVSYGIPATFIILFLLEAISWEQLGILLAVQMAVQLLFDYPTGALGDAIGHRWVLSGAYIGYVIANIFLVIADSFSVLLVYAIIAALAGSQESGTLIAWYDNQYRNIGTSIDPDRKIYGDFMGRLQALNFALFGMSILAGGIIATIWDRRALFIIQIFLFLLVILLIQLRMHSTQSEALQEQKLSYKMVFRDGLRFVFTDKGIFLFFLGWAIIGACNYSIWGSMLLFPIYEAYGRKDSYIGTIRATMYGTGVISNIIWAKISTQINRTKRWIFICIGSANTIFFTAAAIYLYLVPPEHNMIIWKVIGLVIVFTLFVTWEGLGFILINRLRVDLIPDRVRNAVYSLDPTIVLFLSIPFIIIGGIVIEDTGMEIGALLTAGLSAIGMGILGLGLIWLPQSNKRKRNSESLTQ